MKYMFLFAHLVRPQMGNKLEHEVSREKIEPKGFR